MPTFAYRSLSNGPASNGRGLTIDAPDRAAALRELMRRGEAPSELREVDAAKPGAAITRAAGGMGEGLTSRPGRVAMSRAEMATFIREIATALKAGLPLVPALRTIMRQGRGERQREMLAHIIDQVEHGKSLGDAAAAWGKPFSDLSVSMIRAGEAAGRLPEVLTQTAVLLDRDVKLRRSVLSATLYPMILMGLIVLAVIVVVTFIVPQVLKNIPKNMALPWPTQVVQGAAAFFAGYWWAILPLVLVVFWGLGKLYADAAIRYKVDETLLKVPVLGRLLKDVAVARFTRTLGTLTSAGLPIIQSLKITRGTLNNRAMERVIDDVCDQVAAGKTIADPMERSGHFPPMLVQIVNMGERSGRLDELLGQAAEAFEDRTETSIKLFTTALPPVLVVMAAGVVGFIVLSVILPLLQLQDFVAGGGR